MVIEPQVIQIKGIKDGLLVTLGEGEWSGVQEALLSSIEEKASFFQGARMAMEVGNRILHAADLGQLRDRLSDRGIALWAVVSSSPVTEQTAQVLGLATRLSLPRPERTIRPLDTTLEGENGVFIRRTLRSGFKITSHGHVTILGDVNPGAEIIADGNVIVWGRIRGSVIAGAAGDDTAVVCAMVLEPTQLRIANLVANISLKKTPSQPVCAVIRNGIIQIEPWKSKER
ncbi:septum site-determining protein MinC [bacterium]|nr:MAG: septum site-determining protein MinC [bacterium]